MIEFYTSLSLVITKPDNFYLYTILGHTKESNFKTRKILDFKLPDGYIPEGQDSLVENLEFANIFILKEKTPEEYHEYVWMSAAVFLGTFLPDIKAEDKDTLEKKISLFNLFLTCKGIKTFVLAIELFNQKLKP